MQDFGKNCVFRVNSGKGTVLGKTPFPPSRTENLSKGETKMNVKNILDVIGWALSLGSENKEANILWKIASWF